MVRIEESRRSVLAVFALIAASCGVSGCSNHPELAKLDTVPVKGKVTLDGGPLPRGQGSISCIWTGKNLGVDNWGVSGVFNEDGTYELYTSLGLNHGYTGLLARKRGAPPGKYKVEVRYQETFDRSRHSGANPQKSLIPLRYRRSRDSGLTLEVVEDPAPGAYALRLSSR